jgi:dehydrodolichyl diphosphate syntase complex subunit NUS1
MVSARDRELYRRQKLSATDRERLLRPYLPDPDSLSTRPSIHQHRKRPSTAARKKNATRTRNRTRTRTISIRAFLRSQLHQLVYALIHICLGFYVRLSQALAAVIDRIQAIVYYHHRTPELIQKDVRSLSRLPEHLSVILSLHRDDDALQTLMDEVSELAAWTACAGIPTLSIYEKSGILKSCIPALYQAVTDKLSSYYGSPVHQPILRIFAPHHSVYGPSRASSVTRRSSNGATLTILLLSATDGRETLVDLTKTLAEMAQNGKLSPDDISTDLIDAEISEITSRPSQSTPALFSNDNNQGDEKDPVSGNNRHHDTADSLVPPILQPIKPEPDLLLIFGPYVKLDGYPPWQIRLTEIFCTGDRGSSITGGQEAVEYQGFMRALWRYARAQMRFGR